MRHLTGLVGDIGGTNCRLALVECGAGSVRLLARAAVCCADYATAQDAISVFLEEQRALTRPHHAVLAVAGPVRDGGACLTNHVWQLDEAHLATALGFTRVRLINDFAAQALAAPCLRAEELVCIGPQIEGLPGGTIGIMGPGTGFGASALAGGAAGGLLVTEGGHIAFAPTDEVEMDILRILARRHGRVSIERILAGQGLANLHATLEEIEGRPASGLDASAITARAAAGCVQAAATVARFCAILGSVAGDLALAFGAQGGVFIAGGIAPRLLAPLAAGEFRARFEAKGRFAAYMRAIPTRVIVTGEAALRGAADELWRLAQAAGAVDMAAH